MMLRRPPRRPRKPPPSPDARARNDRERQRRCRARSKAGEKRYVIVARENWVTEAMLLSGRMTEADVLGSRAGRGGALARGRRVDGALAEIIVTP